jgi:hypothetical protein
MRSIGRRDRRACRKEQSWLSWQEIRGLRDFSMAQAQMAHFGSMKGQTVLEVMGIGPFDLHYVNPEDDPSAAK